MEYSQLGFMLHFQKAESVNTRPDVNIRPELSSKGLSQEIYENPFDFVEKIMVPLKSIELKSIA